ncbi:MAG TPA: cysteine--tRNA ligase [Candidatus Paceibacterota bacterium]|nr:cysteine--tRNA ligase [Candidatus Paceibacterota bacterium]
MIKIYNTLSGAKEPLPDQKKLRLFVCGPTVYDYQHIGNARTYVFFDFFAKYLRAQGYDVFYLQNITDVDDKIIRRAAEEHEDPADLAKRYTKAYLEDMKALGIDAVTKYAPATDFITQIAAQVERLIEKRYAYRIEDDGWYFDIAKFPDYGKLSHRTAAQAEDSVSRIDESVGKRNKGDFCLWKFSSKAGRAAGAEPSWTTQVGEGRPGWHIEDTAISDYFFGPQYEIHGGGVDLKFPHHEAEIAQQEAASGREPFVRYWVHTGHVLVEGKKMSKSLGNFVTTRDFLVSHPPELLRWITFTSHYRSPVDFSETLAAQGTAAMNTLGSFLAKLDRTDGRTDADAERAAAVFTAKFHEALADDLNTPAAIASMFEFMARFQTNIWSLRASEARMIKKSLKAALDTFGISLPSPKIPAEVERMAKEREKFRKSKQFVQADALRERLGSVGYEIEDTPQGYFLWPRP